MAKDPIVTIHEGQLRGKISKDYCEKQYYSFQGIPYARPPVGELRFKAPQPAEPWTGIKDATEEGNICYHRHMLLGYTGSEDCLFLNVYTPQLPGKGTELIPVMVWIHGGGFALGSGNTDFYGPDFLIIHDVVVVTINYRFGLLGFLSLEDPTLGVPGNAGLKDQVMALKWVQKNIESFCGNPNNVTVFGQSCGGASVQFLMMSPMAKGLFHKAIIHSGTALESWVRGQPSAPLIAEALNLNTGDEKIILSLLKKMTVEELFKVQQKLPDTDEASSIRVFGVVVENCSDKQAFLTEEPIDLIRSGRFGKLPLMIGYTSRESMFVTMRRKAKHKKIINDFKYQVPYILNFGNNKSKLEKVAQNIKKFYYGNEEPSLDNMDQYYMLETDTLFLSNMRYIIKNYVITSPCPTYFFRISLDSNLNIYKKLGKIPQFGTCHGDELGYLFKTVFTPKIRPGSIEDEAIRRFTKLWTTFAKYGNPNPVEKDPLINIAWKPVDKNHLHYLDIGENLTVGINPDASRMEFWEEIYRLHFSKSKL